MSAPPPAAPPRKAPAGPAGRATPGARARTGAHQAAGFESPPQGDWGVHGAGAPLLAVLLSRATCRCNSAATCCASPSRGGAAGGVWSSGLRPHPILATTRCAGGRGDCRGARPAPRVLGAGTPGSCPTLGPNGHDTQRHTVHNTQRTRTQHAACSANAQHRTNSTAHGTIKTTSHDACVTTSRITPHRWTTCHTPSQRRETKCGGDRQQVGRVSDNKIESDRSRYGDRDRDR